MTALLSTTALADTSSMNSSIAGMGILQNDYVKAGVNGTSGSFGSGGSVRPGLQYDSDGTGTFPADGAQGDYLTPGSPFDGWAIKIDGVNSTNNNSGGTTWADADGLADTTNGFTWQGTNSAHAGWQVEHNYSLGTTSEYIDITTNITAGNDAATLSFGRFIDPDAMPEPGDTSATDNVLGYGVIPESNVVFSEATVSRYALGLYSTDSNVGAGITGWSTDADSYTTNSVDGDGSTTNTGDNTIGLTWAWTGINTGDIATANYAYIFGPSAFDAATSAIDGGAGGGASSSWGDLADVGSATDAAGSGPTVVGSASSSVTSHISSVSTGVQTIARSTSTSTWDVYSDASLGTPVVEITNPGSFTGRMDQGSKLENTVDVHTLGFANGFSGGRIESDLGNGVTSNASVYGLGASISTQDSILVDLGINKVSASTPAGTANTTHVGLGLGKSLPNDLTVRGSVNNATADIAYDRTIGDFANSGAYSTSDRWADVEVEASTGTIRPMAGVTVGQRSKDAYTETGSVQSILSGNAVNETYRYVTVGVNMEIPYGEASIARTTSGITRLSLGLDYALHENASIVADINRSISDAATTTSISAGIKWQF